MPNPLPLELKMRWSEGYGEPAGATLDSGIARIHSLKVDMRHAGVSVILRTSKRAEFFRFA